MWNILDASWWPFVFDPMLQVVIRNEPFVSLKVDVGEGLPMVVDEMCGRADAAGISAAISAAIARVEEAAAHKMPDEIKRKVFSLTIADAYSKGFRWSSD